MISKSQIMIWKKIGYEAHNIVCLADRNVDIVQLNKSAKTIHTIIRDLDTADLNQLYEDKGISIKEYADRLSNMLFEKNLNISKLKNQANAIVKIVIDMSYGCLKPNSVYSRIAEVGGLGG